MKFFKRDAAKYWQHPSFPYGKAALTPNACGGKMKRYPRDVPRHFMQEGDRNDADYSGGSHENGLPLHL